jgi:hypothetical protein
VLKGVVIGAAAALVVGAGIVAATVLARPSAPPVAEPAGARGRMQIMLTAPKEPAAPPPGPKLETLPPGTDYAPGPQPAYAPPPRPAPQADPEPLAEASEPAPPRGARAERRRYERAPRDFDDREAELAEADPPADLEEGPEDRYLEQRPRWREPRYEDRRAERYGPEEPYYPEPPPPPWWRR